LAVVAVAEMPAVLVRAAQRIAEREAQQHLGKVMQAALAQAILLTIKSTAVEAAGRVLLE
jgi:hypothetical protein